MVSYALQHTHKKHSLSKGSMSHQGSSSPAFQKSLVIQTSSQRHQGPLSHPSHPAAPQVQPQKTDPLVLSRPGCRWATLKEARSEVVRRLAWRNGWLIWYSRNCRWRPILRSAQVIDSLTWGVMKMFGSPVAIQAVSYEWFLMAIVLAC